jgi:glycine/D-amino acid oxidase-like deaminating enzyme
VLAGMARLEKLGEELDCDFEWRRLGDLVLIEREEHWQQWGEQVAYLAARGVPAQMLDLQALREAEPLLRVDGFLGAAWCLEGHLNPFKFCHALARAARQNAAVLHPNMPVVAFERKGDRLTAVLTTKARFSAGIILVAAGAWTGEVLKLAGASLPVCFARAEAMISVPLPPVLRHHIGLADFYEIIRNRTRAVCVGAAQQKNGTLLITEAVEKLPTIDRSNSIWGVPGMARDLLKYLPRLAHVCIVRAWAAPSPFLPDALPAIGWMPGLTNLFVATCFHLTITTIPVFSDLIAGMLLGERIEPSLEEFSPVRFAVED